MKAYHNIVRNVLHNGSSSADRTGTGTVRLTGAMFEHDMRKGFPAVTTKKLAWQAVVGELLWFLEGSTDVERLREITYGPDSTRTTIWDANYNKQARAMGYRNGELGPIYGAQWDNQIDAAINEIKWNPDSRRILVNSWAVGQLSNMALPPCHFCFQFLPQNDGSLDLVWYQRSCDVFLGLPFNIASYGLLLEIVAAEVGRNAGMLVGMLGDTHIYADHLPQCVEMLSRDPHPLPTLLMANTKFDELRAGEGDVQDYELLYYKHHPALKGKMAV